MNAAYEAHLAALGPSPPDDPRRLWTDIGLCDGLVLRVKRGSGSLELQFRGGNKLTFVFWFNLRSHSGR